MPLTETLTFYLSAIIGVFLLIVTTLIQLTNTKIDKFNDEIRKKELLNIHYLSVLGNYQVSAIYHLLASFDPKRLNLTIKEIEDKFRYTMNEKKELGKMAIQKADEINNMRMKGTPWAKIRSVLFIIQTILIVFTFLIIFI